MIKTLSGTYDWGNEPEIKIVENPKRFLELDGGPLVKKARWYCDIEKDPRYTFANALFLGAGQWYGANLNGDYFPEEELLDRYLTFLDHAKHYKHHKNNDPTNNYGDVFKIYYNPRMHRVEGIIRIDNQRSPETKIRLERGENIPVSMACNVPYDICSICGNKATRKSEYCSDLLLRMRNILANGKMVYAVNPKPTFFDISEVVVGADPTAFMLKKVASVHSFTKPYVISPEQFIVSNDTFRKSSIYQKKSILEHIAALEKKLRGYLNDSNPSIQYLKRGLDYKTIPVKNASYENLLASASKNNIYFSQKDFSNQTNDVVTPTFENLLKMSNLTHILSELPYDKQLKNDGTLDKYAEQRSFEKIFRK